MDSATVDRDGWQHAFGLDYLMNHGLNGELPVIVNDVPYQDGAVTFSVSIDAVDGPLLDPDAVKRLRSVAYHVIVARKVCEATVE
jgi:hypothetical protein